MERFEFDKKLIESYNISRLLVQGQYVDDETLRRDGFDVGLVRADEEIRNSIVDLIEKN